MSAKQAEAEVNRRGRLKGSTRDPDGADKVITDDEADDIVSDEPSRFKTSPA